MRRIVVAALLLTVCPGCPVFQSQEVPHDPAWRREPVTGRDYREYVPSDYTPEKQWPLVITLHGTDVPAYDTSRKQIDAWKKLAEDKGFIVAAPELTSVQGVVPVIRSLWYDDLAEDEQAILAVLDDLRRRYSIDDGRVMLTGFSSGGFPLFYTGLRNPQRFNCLASRSCNVDLSMLERVGVTDAARELPILLIWGKDDFTKIRHQSWAAFEYLRRHGFDKTEADRFRGGHIRRPDLAYDFWKRQPARRGR